MDDFFTIDQPTPPSSSNGLGAAAWVAIGAIDPRLAEPLLATLRTAGVGAYVAPFTSRSRTHLEMRLWVDASLRTEAERAVAAALPELRGELDESDDDWWAAIVASLQEEPTDESAPWPAAEGYGAYDVSREDDGPPLPRMWRVEEPESEPELDPDDHFVPPDPAPLPPTSQVTKYGWAAFLTGIVILIVPALFGHAIGNGWLAIGILSLVGGFLTLVLRLKDGPPDDSDPDDGAVV
jgi:hypothetical protein